MQGLFISGSGTNVGKTFVAQRLITLLNKTRNVKVRKPVESDCQWLDGQLVTKDAQLLSATSNANESIEVVCPFRFEACTSGEVASKRLGVRLNLDDLVNACKSDEFVVVEGAGGFYSPIGKQVLNADLAKALNLPVVLVVKDELGAVNQALLTIAAAQKNALHIAMLVLNQITPNTLNNAKAIRQYTNTPVVVFDDDFETTVLDLL